MIVQILMTQTLPACGVQVFGGFLRCMFMGVPFNDLDFKIAEDQDLDDVYLNVVAVLETNFFSVIDHHRKGPFVTELLVQTLDKRSVQVIQLVQRSGFGDIDFNINALHVVADGTSRSTLKISYGPC